MLIINFTENQIIEPVKRRFHRKPKKSQPCFVRRNITVNNKSHIYLEYPLCMIDSDEFVKLLERYRGSILVCNAEQNSFINESFIFNPTEYFSRALLSSLRKQVEFGRNAYNSLGIKTDSFYDYAEYYDIVKTVQKVTLITQPTPVTERFRNSCYTNYGAYVNVDKTCVNNHFDIYFNCSQIDEKGRVFINLNGISTLLYPDPVYFIKGEGMGEIIDMGIKEELVCAAFSNI